MRACLCLSLFRNIDTIPTQKHVPSPPHCGDPHYTLHVDHNQGRAGLRARHWRGSDIHSTLNDL